MIDAIGGLKAYEDFTFEKFDGSLCAEAFSAALAFDPDRDNLYFWGPSRTGKTHLAVATARPTLERHEPVYFCSLARLKDSFKTLEGNHDYGAKTKFLDMLTTVKVLVIHEFGRGPSSDYFQEVLLTILDERIMKARNGLILTAQFDPKDPYLESKYGASVMERIFEMCGRNLLFFPQRKRGK